jgi:hypothetical protein
VMAQCTFVPAPQFRPVRLLTSSRNGMCAVESASGHD